MLERLPHSIDPISFADKQRTLQGQIPLSKLERLADVLLNTDGHVALDLNFKRDGRVPVIQGRVKADLQLQCNNCLKALHFPLEVTINLGVVQSLEQAERLSGEYEPLMLESEKIPLHEIIEDEILLALPDFPKHDNECQSYQQATDEARKPAVNDTRQSKPNNPFSVLAKLKNIGD